MKTGGLLFPAADDNASGVVDLLEAARVLSKYSFDRTLVFFFSTGEEEGALGVKSYLNDIEILYANGLTGGCSTSPLKFCPDQIMNRGQAAVFTLRGNYGTSFKPDPPLHIFKDDWTKGIWAEPWAEAMYAKGLSTGCLTFPLKYVRGARSRANRRSSLPCV